MDEENGLAQGTLSVTMVKVNTIRKDTLSRICFDMWCICCVLCFIIVTLFIGLIIISPCFLVLVCIELYYGDKNETITFNNETRELHCSYGDISYDQLRLDVKEKTSATPRLYLHISGVEHHVTPVPERIMWLFGRKYALPYSPKFKLYKSSVRKVQRKFERIIEFTSIKNNPPKTSWDQLRKEEKRRQRAATTTYSGTGGGGG